MSSRKQSKRAAFAHRRRKGRRLVAEFKAWDLLDQRDRDDRVDSFLHQFLLKPMPMTGRPNYGPGWLSIAGPVQRESFAEATADLWKRRGFA